MSAVIVKDGEGSFIPATQRADGSWRKARRVKDGYVPQEEVPLYESKGKQWANRKPLSVPDPPAARQKEIELAKNNKKYSPIPGLIIDPNNEVKKKKKKKKKSGTNSDATANEDDSVSNVTNKAKAQKQSQSERPKSNSSQKSEDQSAPQDTTGSSTSNSVAIDPIKRIKNLKKKLREIDALEQKIADGETKSLDKDQLDKVSRKPEVLSEILALELTLQD